MGKRVQFSWKPPFASGRFAAPKPRAGDSAHAVIKGVLSGVPLVGNLGAELFGLTFAPPFQRRQQEWMETVTEKLLALDGSRGRLEGLAKSPEFVTLVVQATQSAGRTHHEEKLASLRNILLNSAERPEVDTEMRQRCIALVDQLSASQLKMLRAEQERRHPYSELIVPIRYSPSDDRTDGGNWGILQELYKDLERLGLVEQVPDDERSYPRRTRRTEPRTKGFGQVVVESRLTLLGERLLEYISDVGPR